MLLKPSKAACLRALGCSIIVQAFQQLIADESWVTVRPALNLDLSRLFLSGKAQQCPAWQTRQCVGPFASPAAGGNLQSNHQFQCQSRVQADNTSFLASCEMQCMFAHILSCNLEFSNHLMSDV